MWTLSALPSISETNCHVTVYWFFHHFISLINLRSHQFTITFLDFMSLKSPCKEWSVHTTSENSWLKHHLFFEVSRRLMTNKWGHLTCALITGGPRGSGLRHCEDTRCVCMCVCVWGGLFKIVVTHTFDSSYFLKSLTAKIDLSSTQIGTKFVHLSCLIRQKKLLDYDNLTHFPTYM